MTKLWCYCMGEFYHETTLADQFELKSLTRKHVRHAVACCALQQDAVARSTGPTMTLHQYEYMESPKAKVLRTLVPVDQGKELCLATGTVQQHDVSSHPRAWATGCLTQGL